jgi:hypothetical protein
VGWWIEYALFWVVVVMGELMFSVLLVDAMVVVGSRFLGSGRVGAWVDRLMLCFLWGCVVGEEGDSVTCDLACFCKSGIRMFCRRSW